MTHEIKTYQGIATYFAQRDRDYVTHEIKDGIATVTLNDPKKLNCLSGYLTIQLREVLESINADPNVKVVVLTGADPAFSAGGDLELISMAHDSLRQNDSEGATVMRNWIRLQFGGIARAIRHSEKLYIAAVNGAVAGVGLAFAFAADLIYASDRASFVPAFGKIGLVPEVGSNWFLVRRLGYQKAFEYFLKGQPISAPEALQQGIVNGVYPHDALLRECLYNATKFQQYPPELISMTKTLLQRACDNDWTSMIEMEEFAEAVCFTTQFHQQAVANLARR